MINSFAIIIENQDVLGNLCGVNDENLKVLEGLVGSSVFCRGNEIMIGSEDEQKQTFFRKIIEQLIEHSKIGHPPGRDLIQAVAVSVKNGEKEKENLLKNHRIVLPGEGKTIFPRSVNQAHYLKTLEEKSVVFAIGPAGTGKTYLAVAYAVNQILQKNFRKMILTRPVVEAGESLGFLPGDFTQKISPYLRPLYDALDTFVAGEMISKMEEHRIIELAPLAYMRGRSLPESLVILDEAQNTTSAQMKMFLTRLGEGSKAIITGDITQTDLPGKNRSGLMHVIDLLQDIEGISFVYFNTSDVVRNPLVRKIVEAYENERKK